MPATSPIREQISTRKPWKNAVTVEMTRTARMVQSSGVSVCMARSYRNSAEIELSAGEGAVSIQVLALRFCHDVIRQCGRGGPFVPLDALQVIADKLFVEGGLRAAGSVLVGGPVTGGVGGKDLVGQHDAVRGD